MATEQSNTPKITSSYLDSILQSDVTLRHIVMLISMQRSDDKETRELATSYYQAFWKNYTKNRGNVRGSNFGDKAAWGIVLIRDTIAYSFDQTTGCSAKWEQQFNKCVELHVETRSTVRGKRRDSIIVSLYYLMSSLLSVLDRIAEDPAEAAAVKHSKDTVEYVALRTSEIERDIHSLIVKHDRRVAQQTYLLGMIPGLIIVAAVVYTLTLITSKVVNLQYLRIVLSAGALGALLSVMTRMTQSRFSRAAEVDDQAGIPLLLCAGAFRPLVGALFGCALYVLIASGLLPLKTPPGAQSLFYVAAIAFLAGFSERFAQDAVVNTSRGILIGASDRRDG